jgi:hypothetical protein
MAEFRSVAFEFVFLSLFLAWMNGVQFGFIGVHLEDYRPCEGSLCGASAASLEGAMGYILACADPVGPISGNGVNKPSIDAL